MTEKKKNEPFVRSEKNKQDGRNERNGSRADRAVRDRRNDRSDRGEEERDESLVIGRNAVRELLKTDRTVDKIYLLRGPREGSVLELIGKASEKRIPMVEVDRYRLDKMSGGENHQGIIAVAAVREYATLDDLFRIAEERGESPFFVLCDGVEDPHNLGAIIRSAEGCGAHGVIIPKRHSVGLSGTVSKASAGAVEHTAVVKVTNLAACIDTLKEKGVWVYAAEAGGNEYEKTDFSGPCALLLGSEGEGVSRLCLQKADGTVSIPMYGQVNSFNVSCAASVLLCEIARQKHRA